MKSRLLAQRIIDPAHGFLILTRAEIRQCACEFVDVAERVQRTQPDRTIAGFDRDRRTSVAPKGLDKGLGPPGVGRIGIKHEGAIQRRERYREIESRYRYPIRSHPERIGVIGPKLDRYPAKEDTLRVLWPRWENPTL